MLDRTDRDYCDGCRPERQAEQAAVWAAGGLDVLARRRASGADPAHGGAAGRERGRRNAAHLAAIARWEQEHTSTDYDDPEAFARDILPMLRGVPLGAIAHATQLSLAYCSFIRRGRKVPHHRHWTALARLGNEYRPDSQASPDERQPTTGVRRDIDLLDRR